MCFKKLANNIKETVSLYKCKAFKHPFTLALLLYAKFQHMLREKLFKKLFLLLYSVQ
jgi:hypothetical protein